MGKFFGEISLIRLPLLTNKSCSWWHLMTGIGAYFYIVWGIWLRHCLNGRQDEFEMIWPRIMFSFPRVERIHTASNGVLKKTN